MAFRDRDKSFKTKQKNVSLCDICTLLMNDPRVLPCGHSFCKVCIDTWHRTNKHADGDNASVCPFCRRPFVLDLRGADGLPKNFQLKNAIDLFQAEASRTDISKNESYTCGNCSTTAGEIKLCVECDKNVCSKCSEKHESNHLLLEPHEIKSLKSRREFCKIHPSQKLELYCSDHGIPICNSCGLTEHRNHQLTNISTIGEECRQFYTQLQDYCIESSQNCGTKHAELQEKITLLKESYDKARDKAENFITKVTSILREKTNTKLVELKENYESIEEEIKSETDNNCRRRENLQSLCELVKNLLAYGSDLDIVEDTSYEPKWSEIENSYDRPEMLDFSIEIKLDISTLLDQFIRDIKRLFLNPELPISSNCCSPPLPPRNTKQNKSEIIDQDVTGSDIDWNEENSERDESALKYPCTDEHGIEKYMQTEAANTGHYIHESKENIYELHVEETTLKYSCADNQNMDCINTFHAPPSFIANSLPPPIPPRNKIQSISNRRNLSQPKNNTDILNEYIDALGAEAENTSEGFETVNDCVDDGDCKFNETELKCPYTGQEMEAYDDTLQEESTRSEPKIINCKKTLMFQDELDVTGIAISDGGKIFVVCSNQSTVPVFNSNGMRLSEIKSDSIKNPFDITIARDGKHKTAVFLTDDGKTTFGIKMIRKQQLRYKVENFNTDVRTPQGIASLRNQLIVCDAKPKLIKIFDITDRRCIRIINGNQGELFNTPWYISTNPIFEEEHVYTNTELILTDSSTKSVLVLCYNGNLKRIYDKSTFPDSFYPTKTYLDHVSGTLYIADQGNREIFVVRHDNITKLGYSTFRKKPIAMDFDKNQNLWVASRKGSFVRFQLP